MSTSVKVVTRDGKFGLLLHKHGNSAWHPVNEKHSRFVGRLDRDNDEGSHDLHDAAHPVAWIGEFTPALKREYQEVLSTSIPQAFWNVAWKAKLAARKANRLAREKASSAPALVATPAGFSDPSILD